MTAKERAYVASYYRATETSVCGAYLNPSKKKRIVEDTLRRKMESLGEWGFRILSHNAQTFTCAYKYKVGGEEYMNVETKYNTYIIALED